MPQLLEPELETFERHRDELLGKAEGKFVLIFREQIVGIFDTQNDAIQHGYRTLGNTPFLVKQILKVETPQNFISNLGL
jgi:hypothetical protein